MQCFIPLLFPDSVALTVSCLASAVNREQRVPPEELVLSGASWNSRLWTLPGGPSTQPGPRPLRPEGRLLQLPQEQRSVPGETCCMCVFCSAQTRWSPSKATSRCAAPKLVRAHKHGDVHKQNASLAEECQQFPPSSEMAHPLHQCSLFVFRSEYWFVILKYSLCRQHMTTSIKRNSSFWIWNSTRSWLSPLVVYYDVEKKPFGIWQQERFQHIQIILCLRIPTVGWEGPCCFSSVIPEWRGLCILMLLHVDISKKWNPEISQLVWRCIHSLAS